MVTRYHYLDAARGILMIMGIVYHASLVYGDGGWVITDVEGHGAFAALAGGLRTFRMPAFFLMSGLFAGLTLEKYGPGPFIAKRTPRVLIPFLTALLTLNVVQLYALHVYQGGDAADLRYFVSSDLWGDFTSDRWISHLWFLICLFYYFAAVALAAAFAGRGRGRTLAARAGGLTALVSRPVICLALLPLINLAVLALFGAFPGLYRVRPLINLDTIAVYVPYFAVGLLSFANPRLYASLTSFSVGAVMLTAAAVMYASAGPMPAGELSTHGLAPYGHYLWTWLGVYWVMVVLRSILDRPNRFAATLADSSYTIYLFHHLTVILIAWLLLDVDLHIFLKFAIVITVAFAITYALHQRVIRTVPLLSLLFNGKMKTT